MARRRERTHRTSAAATYRQRRAGEASRRPQALVGARDAAHLKVVLSNAQREASRLYAIRLGIPGVVEGREWSSEEAHRAAELFAADQAIEAIRAASNRLEVMAPVPADFRDNRWWMGEKAKSVELG